MKKFVSLILIGLSIISTVGCFDKYRELDPNANSNNTGRPTNPGSIRIEESSWNWSGNDPFSYTIEGVPKQIGNKPETDYWEPDQATISLESTDGEIIDFKVPIAAVSGAIYPADMYLTTTDDAYWFPQSGAIKILENNSTYIKGQFIASFRNPLNGRTKRVERGYFNVKKEF